MPDEMRAEALEAMARDVSHEIYAMWTDAAVNLAEIDAEIAALTAREGETV